MILAEMMRISKDDVICDMAETYHILDIRSVRLTTLSTLAVGLRESSRIKMRISGAKAEVNTLLLASIADRLGIMLWRETKDGRKGINQPKLLVNEMTKTRKNDIVGYSTGADFLAERKRLMDG